MSALWAGAHDVGAEPATVVDFRPTQDLEVPRPLRLLLTAGWNLTESVGLPVGAYLIAAAPGRRAGGHLAHRGHP